MNLAEKQVNPGLIYRNGILPKEFDNEPALIYTGGESADLADKILGSYTEGLLVRMHDHALRWYPWGQIHWIEISP